MVKLKFNLNLNFITFILLIREFFILALADGFPLEFEWQQVSSSLQDSSQYYDRMDDLHSYSYF